MTEDGEERPRTVADEDIPTVRVTGSDKDISSDVGSKLFERPVTESAGAGRNSHCPSDVCEKHFGRLVTEKMTIRAGNDVNFSSDDISEMYRQFREWMTTQAGSNEPPVEQSSCCRIPGCSCEGRIEYMEWGPEDMTETDDSEYEDPDERANRLYAESYNYDLSEGMTPETYTPPLRKNRRRRYEVRKKNGPETEESIDSTSDRGFQTNEDSPNLEPTVQPRMVVDEDIPTVRDRKDNRGRRRRTESDKDISSDEDSKVFDRPVTESVTAWAGSDTDHPSGEHLKIFNQPVTESVTAWEADTGAVIDKCVNSNYRTIGTRNKGVGRNRFEWHTCV